MAEGLREPARSFLWLPALIRFLPNGQIPESVKHKTPLLMLTRQCVFRGQIERGLGLLVVVGGVVVGSRKCVARREFQFFIHFAAETQGDAVVGRTGRGLHFIDVAEVRVEPSRQKDFSSYLLWRWIRNPKLAAFAGVRTTGGSTFTLIVRGSPTPWTDR